MSHEHHDDHTHQEHGHVHVHAESVVTVKGSQRAFFAVGFLGGIAGLSFIGVTVLVWFIFGQASSLIDAAPQSAESADIVGE